jgi:hypothetical protein
MIYDILVIVIFSAISVLVIESMVIYYKNFINDYKNWNNGISPFTNKCWILIGKDAHNIKHYRDELNNSISIKTVVDILF